MEIPATGKEGLGTQLVTFTEGRVDEIAADVMLLTVNDSMDTDSAYMALSATSLEEVIKPEMQQRFRMEKKNWFPRDDTPEHAAYDKRTPGLFKTEFTGDGMIALCSKTYYCFGKEDKFSCKGINKRLNDIHNI
jgi:hypothetical protein